MRMRVTTGRAALLAAGLLFPVLAAGEESRFEKALRLDPGGRFSIRTDLGGVTVTGVNAPGARIVITSRRPIDDLLRLTFREDAGSVTVTGRRVRGHFFPWIGERGNVRFEIQVPTQTELDVDTSGGAIKISGLSSPAKLETSGGGIRVRDLAGDLEAHTSGGGIELDHIRGRVRVETSGGGIEGREIDGPIEADTSGGSVNLERVSGDIRAHSSGGGIHISEAGSRIEADTSGGGIVASFARGNARGGSLETSGGGIRVSVDPTVGLRIDASGNSVRAEIPITVQGSISRGKLQGNMGGGGELLRLHTSGGGVQIQGL